MVVEIWRISITQIQQWLINTSGCLTIVSLQTTIIQLFMQLSTVFISYSVSNTSPLSSVRVYTPRAMVPKGSIMYQKHGIHLRSFQKHRIVCQTSDLLDRICLLVGSSHDSLAHWVESTFFRHTDQVFYFFYNFYIVNTLCNEVTVSLSVLFQFSVNYRKLIIFTKYLRICVHFHLLDIPYS